MKPELQAQPRKQVRCPHCAQWCAYAPDNRWRPFCSERCRSHDLGAWASDSYRLSASEGPPADASRDDG